MYSKPHLDKKHVVILGGGYCGLRTAKELAKKLEGFDDYQVLLVDKSSLHFYAADLYEIATAYYPQITKACLRELSSSITIPFAEVLKGTKVCFLHDTIEGINYAKKSVRLKNGGEISFEYLVVALGAVTNFYGLDGVQEHAFPLKTLADGMALECHFEQVFQERKKLNVVIGGGGFTGVEYACELPGFIKKLSKKYAFNPHDVKITVVQSGPQLVGLGNEVSRAALKRFQELGVEAIFNTRIHDYKNGKLEVTNKDGSGQRFLDADVLVWTAGIQPNPLLQEFSVLHESGCLDVEANLESMHYPRVYAGGDNAAVFDLKTDGMMPKLGVLAVEQAPIIAHNVWASIVKKPQKAYFPKEKGFIISLGGKFFLSHKGSATRTGIWPWLQRRKFDFWYFHSLLPFGKAFRKWWKTENIFMQND